MVSLIKDITKTLDNTSK